MPIPLKVKTHNSLCEGFCKPDEIAKICVEQNIPGCAITDRNVMYGCFDFSSAMHDCDKTPIIGVDLAISEDGQNRAILLAKNLDGYYELIKIYNSKRDKNYIDHNVLFDYHNIICICDSSNITLLEQLQEHFGDDIYIDLEYPSVELRKIASTVGIRAVATSDSTYHYPQDQFDFHTLLAIGLKVKYKNLEQHCKDKGLYLTKYFCDPNNNAFSTAIQKISDPMFLEHEISASDEIFSKCENYKLSRNPIIPKLKKIPSGYDENSYLRKLCIDGWRTKIDPMNLSSEKRQVYGERVKEELDLFTHFGLSHYFLVVSDIVNWAKNNGILVAPGRGSVGGSLVGYLLNITSIDSIEYGLMLMRFMNFGRMSKDHISLPDIDCDFPVEHRQDVINYIFKEYGSDDPNKITTSQVIVFGNLMGKGSLKYILTAHDVCSPEQQNAITSYIPDEAKITEELEEMEKGGHEKSIIKWAVMNYPKEFGRWVKYNKKKDQFEGDYAEYFEQAIRLERTKHHTGKHAAGILISPIPLNEVVPMVWDDKEKTMICAYEYTNAEKCGPCKIDILGLAALDKVMGVINGIK